MRGLAAYDPDPTFLTDDGVAFERERVDRECIFAVTLLLLKEPRETYVTSDPAQDPDWARRFDENSVGNRSAAAPLLVPQGTADETIDPALTARFVTRACGQGATVQSVTIDGADHATVVADAEATVLPWIADRFTDRRPPSDC